DLEEARHQVVAAAGELPSHERARELEVGLVAGGDGLVVAAAVDDLDVVDADDGQPVAPAEQPGEALEVAQDGVGRELLDDPEVLAHVLRPAGHTPGEVAGERLP